MVAGDYLLPPTRSEEGGAPSGRQQTNRVMWAAVALALLSSLAYAMIGASVLGVGPVTGPAGIVYAAVGGYLLGGLLILARRRWLWVVGAGINTLVIWIFISAYQDRPAVFFSPGGLITKAAQLLLEVCLVYLIVTYGPRRSRHPKREEAVA